MVPKMPPGHTMILRLFFNHWAALLADVHHGTIRV